MMSIGFRRLRQQARKKFESVERRLECGGHVGGGWGDFDPEGALCKEAALGLGLLKSTQVQQPCGLPIRTRTLCNHQFRKMR